MFAASLLPAVAQEMGASRNAIEPAVSTTIKAVMEEYDVPGIAVGLVINGERHFFYYGFAEPCSDRPVTDNTIFEIGSLSKTFTGAFGAHAAATGALSYSDPASRHLADFDGHPIGNVTLEQLATYAAGGLPLQFPEGVNDDEDIVAYYQNWQPAYRASTQRVYSNPSIGLFGHLAAKASGGDFVELVEQDMLPALGLSNTFIDVPADRMGDYAWGLSRDGANVRVSPGALDAQAYGIKTTAADMLRFVELNIDGGSLPGAWPTALADTRQPRFAVGAMMQGLGWEAYSFPVSRNDLLAGNSTEMALDPNPIAPIDATPEHLFLNKTGSTGGFGAYAAFIPSQRVGIVRLANRNYPNAARIEAAQSILAAIQR